VLSGPGQVAVSNSYSSASYQPQPQSNAQAYHAANPPPYAAPVYPSDPRAAAAGYTPSFAPAMQQPQQHHLPPQQPPADPRAKIEAIRAAIAAQTVSAQPAGRPGNGQPPGSAGLLRAAAATAPLAAPLSARSLPPPAAALTAGAASPAAPLAVAAFDLFSILQNAGVKPLIAGAAAQSSSAGPQPSDRQAPQGSGVPPEDNASALQGSAAALSTNGGAPAVVKQEVKAEAVHTAAAPAGPGPNIQPDMIALLANLVGADARQTVKADVDDDSASAANIQQEMIKLLDTGSA
jgi:hypothetical protein